MLSDLSFARSVFGVSDLSHRTRPLLYLLAVATPPHWWSVHPVHRTTVDDTPQVPTSRPSVPNCHHHRDWDLEAVNELAFLSSHLISFIWHVRSNCSGAKKKHWKKTLGKWIISVTLCALCFAGDSERQWDALVIVDDARRGGRFGRERRSAAVHGALVPRAHPRHAARYLRHPALPRARLRPGPRTQRRHRLQHQNRPRQRQVQDPPENRRHHLPERLRGRNAVRSHGGCSSVCILLQGGISLKLAPSLCGLSWEVCSIDVSVMYHRAFPPVWEDTGWMFSLLPEVEKATNCGIGVDCTRASWKICISWVAPIHEKVLCPGGWVCAQDQTPKEKTLQATCLPSAKPCLVKYCCVRTQKK